jgi:hypothetical protein
LCPFGSALGIADDAIGTGAVETADVPVGVRMIHTSAMAIAPTASAISSSVLGETAIVSRSTG